MKNLKVNNCINCPFHQFEYDDWAVDVDSYHICSLSQFYQDEEYFIDCYDSGSKSDNFDIETPAWCRLKREDYQFKFENMNKNENGNG